MAVTHPNGSASPRALHALLLESRLDDPLDEPIAPLGEHGYTTLARVIPSALAVLRVAARIEPEPHWLMDWYRHTRIAELGHLTAEQLVAMGRAPVVIAFLQSIRRGVRG
ncbi:hypothetical protein [Dyella sp.]|jgi:hypothetical protein|uniref:hypothetical protein n=1 Tax=Dyella sp. TaxID=1869338 RepID=UPI002D788B5B|nr:hypothetical protein [Dyella sp.]HET6433740.1 hypothetical protein [Dyella sp.]